MVRFAHYLIFIIFFIFSALTPNEAFAQTVCQSISGCTNLGTARIKEYNLDADGVPECIDERTTYDCSGTRCFQDSTTCTEVQYICNNGVGNTPSDGYTCTNYCDALAIPDHCGNYPPSDPRPTCSAYIQKCLDQYCRAASGGTNYTCPSPQECISPPDSKAHQCITPVVIATPTPTLTPTPISPPTVDLRVNSVKSVTVNSGDGIVLSWTTTNTDPNRRCTGRDAFFGVSPYPGDSPYPTIIQTNTGDSNLTKTYTLFCYNSNGVASQASSVSVTIKPPQPGRPVCIPSCPNSADVNCGNSLGRDSCEGSCPGTGTKCNNSSQSCQNGRCITPTTFACQIWAQQPVNPCTSSPCPVNLGANYSGPRSGIIQQCWSFNSSPAECNTSSGITSRNLTCGQSTSVRLVARDNAGSGPNQAECTTNITPTCSNDTAFNSTNGLVCLRGDNNCSTTGDGKWYAGWPAARHQCNYPGGTNHNITDQVYKDGICWREPETIEPSAGGVYAHGTFFDEGGRELIMPVVYYWMRGVPFCTQQVNGKCWAGGQPGFNTGTGPSPNSWEKSFYDPSPHHDRPVYISMMEWSPDYYLTDAYSFQTVAASNRRCTYRCNSSRPDCTGRRYQLYCKPNKDTPCGDTCDAECLEDECTSDLKCVRTETPQRISFGEVLSNPSYSESTTPVRVNYCTSHNGQRARINFHFKKAIYKISGTIFYDDNQDGIKDESERRIYDSGGTVVLNLSGTASSPSINLSSDNKPTGYSFDNLRGGNYLLRFTLPPGARLRITSPNPVSYPLFQPLNSDQVVNFGITDNPDAWIQTVGGDVHSNTLINTPGGP